MRSTTELRDEILTAARAEFAQYGLAGSRIDRIAKAAKASKERLYAHFGDKETLFREVALADAAEFFRSVTMAPEDVAEYAAGVYDLASRHPEHLRMLTWARLEGFALPGPDSDGHPIPATVLAAIAAAQADGRVDPSWKPDDLIVLLFGVGLAWAHLPDAVTGAADETTIAHRRTLVIEAARRIITAPGA
ncbi:TetR family transcriptional regulator [Mycolicibacterium sp. 120266]|uniref:TetR/AcrR family transcriptional regulator n=1 Tax=Mycolicibacterium sp. 120266 TaxID=3090601 RepID=UPI00299EDE31|nr:TetR family transcriptional regulator [Mycolicibacterium sp. 120266]MDX1871262.1 TetR family transcriptional regulator [Mycolicibacterium sp. 120266]